MSTPISVCKTSFSGGEVAPELHSHTDLAKYPTWLAKAYNVCISPSGYVYNKPGSHMMAEAKYGNKVARVRKFIFSTLQTYELEFGEYYIRFFTVGPTGGQIQKYSTWVANTAYAVGDFVLNSGTYYRCKTANSDATFIVGKWDSTSWVTSHGYIVGDYVTYAGLIYYCKTAHTSGAWATTNWTQQTILEIPTPYAEADLEWLKFTQSADVLFIDSPDFSPKQLNRLGAVNWTLTNYDFTGGPFLLPNTDYSILVAASAVTGLGITLTASAPAWLTVTEYAVGDYCTESGTVYQCLIAHVSGTFATDLSAVKWIVTPLVLFHSTHAPHATNGGVGALWLLRHYIEGQKVTQSGVGTSAGISCGGIWRVISHGTWTGDFTIEKSTDNGVTWTKLRAFTGAGDININTYGTEDMSNNADPFLVRIVVGSGSPTVDLTTDPFYQQGIVEITGYTSPTQVTGNVVRRIGLTTAIPDWSEGAWSDYRGWPSVVEFDPQDRLTHGNTYWQPQTFWLTKSSNYYDFSRSDPLVDSDGITANLPSREVNGINNIVPLITLLMLTSSGEWSIGDPGTVLTPASTTVRPNGYVGASGVDCVVVGNRAIFVQQMGGLIQDLGYELTSYSFTGADLSILANHLFTGYSITSMDYQKYPGRIVFCGRSDGKLLCMTYMREQEILAWTWWDTGLDGADEYESVSVVPTTGYDELWTVVKRGSKRYIERTGNRFASTAPEDQFFVDCGVTYDGSPVDTITGLPYPDGTKVAVLADGNVIANYLAPLTVASGEITLPDLYSVVHVGIPYYSDIETLNAEMQMRDGSIQGKKTKISQFTLKVVNTLGGWIGIDFNTLFPLRSNSVIDYENLVNLYTGDIKDVLSGGYQDNAHICIRQYDPLPLQVVALIPRLTIGGPTA
jgi:chitodextrinase